MSVSDDLFATVFFDGKAVRDGSESEDLPGPLVARAFEEKAGTEEPLPVIFFSFCQKKLF